MSDDRRAASIDHTRRGAAVAVPDVVLAAGTLKHLPFDERVRLAAGAGFAGIGISVDQYDRLLQSGWTEQRIRSVLSEDGISILEVEAIFGFGRHGHPDHPLLRTRTYSDPHVERTAFAIAETFGVRTVQAVGALEGRADDETVAAFAALCDRAALSGTRIALEFIPATCVPDAATAGRIVREAGRSNGGICADSWHFFRGTADPEQLSALQPEHLFLVQLDDGPLLPRIPDYFEDTTRHRRLPGEGEFDLDRFLGTLLPKSQHAHVSVEILSDAQQGTDAGREAARIAGSVRQAMQSALARPT